MEKSMVHQLNPLIASNVQFSRASFIHTVYQTDFNELRKSRIQNLPNYKKQDLSGKLNFVVVFQGIEIQRLSVEVETLRMKIKDYERQICNYQNYEVQIRQLTEKCHSYEMQREDHQQDMEKMHKVCQQLYHEVEQMRTRYADIDISLKQKYRLQKQRTDSLTHEIQKWKARYNASQTSKIRQLQDVRMMLQHQRKSMLQRQLREISVKHESERSMIQNQLRKLRQLLDNRNLQIHRIKNDLQQSHIREGELRQYQSRLDQYEDKLIMMSQQNMRLSELLRMKKQQIQNFKNNQRNLENKLVNFGKIEDEFNQVNRRIQSYEIEIRDWNQKFSKLQSQNNKNQILSNKAQQYSRLLDNSVEQMDRMGGIIRLKLNEIEKLTALNQRLSLDLDEAKGENGKVTQYQNHITQIKGQNQRLNDILKSRLQQIQTWKSKYSQIELKLSMLDQSQNECKSLRDKISVQINLRAQMTEKIKILENDLGKAAELESLYIKQKNLSHELHKQIQRLNSSIRSISSQNNDFVKKLQTVENQLKENSGLVNEINECKKKIVLMTQQIDRINGILHTKLQQIQKLKQNYNSVTINTAKYRAIQEQFVVNLQQTEQLVLKLDETRRHNDVAQENIATLEDTCNKLQNQLFSNNQQKQKLISILNQKKTEIDDYIVTIEKNERKIASLTQVQKQFANLKGVNASLEQKFKELQARYSRQSKRSEQFSNQVEALSTEIMKLKTESNFSKQFIGQYVALKTQAQQKDKMIINLLQRINSIEKIIQMLKQEGKKNYNNMCLYHEKWKNLNNTVEVITIFAQKYFDLQNKMQKLSQQNLQLESSVRILNVNAQMVQSKYADENVFKKGGDYHQTISTSYQKTTNTNLTSPRNKGFANEAQSRPFSNIEPSKYYESQVRQVPSNFSPSNFSPSYSNVNSNQFYQNPTEGNISYVVKTSLRPGSQQTTYTTYANYGNQYVNQHPFGNSQVINIVGNHPNYHVSQGNNISGVAMSPGVYKFSSSQVRTNNQQTNGEGRRYVLSPVHRYLN